jgi:hypothetical protein
MSWRERRDLGLETIAQIHEALRIEDDWSIESGLRGFTWWPDRLAQHIWSEESTFFNSQAVFKVHAETDLVKGNHGDIELEHALIDAMKSTALSGIVYEEREDLYRLHSSMYVHADNIEVLRRLLFSAAALQVVEAREIVSDVSRRLNAEPASSAHPRQGARFHPSSLVNAVAAFFSPAGKEPSRWIGAPEWKQTEWAMERQSSSYESDHSSHLQAAFDWGVASATLEVTTADPNPTLGNGLTFRLRLPVALSQQARDRIAIRLNGAERADWLRCHFLGSWCEDQGSLGFECFVPNTSYNPDLLLSLSVAMSVRAQWSAEYYPSLERG